jgi:hypothetical protein
VIIRVDPPIAPASAFEDDSENDYRHHTNYTRAIFSDRYESGRSHPGYVHGEPRRYVHEECAQKYGRAAPFEIEVEVDTEAPEQ